MLKLINTGIWSLFISKNTHCRFIVSQAAFSFFGILGAFLVHSFLETTGILTEQNRGLFYKPCHNILPVALAGGGGAGHGFLEGLQEVLDAFGA